MSFRDYHHIIIIEGRRSDVEGSGWGSHVVSAVCQLRVDLCTIVIIPRDISGEEVSLAY